MSKRQKFATQIDENLLEQLRAIAHKDGRQIQAIVEDALSSYLKARGQNPAPVTGFAEEGQRLEGLPVLQEIASELKMQSEVVSKLSDQMVETNAIRSKVMEAYEESLERFGAVYAHLADGAEIPKSDVMDIAKAHSQRYKKTLEYLAQ